MYHTRLLKTIIAYISSSRLYTLSTTMSYSKFQTTIRFSTGLRSTADFLDHNVLCRTSYFYNKTIECLVCTMKIYLKYEILVTDDTDGNVLFIYQILYQDLLIKYRK